MRYGEQELSRLRFIKTAQWLGFSLDEIANLLQLEGGAHCDDVSKIAAEKLVEVRKKLSDLQIMEKTLSELLEACADSSSKTYCPIIETLQDANYQNMKKQKS